MSEISEAKITAVLTVSMFREPIEEGGTQSIDVVNALEALTRAIVREELAHKSARALTEDERVVP